MDEKLTVIHQCAVWLEITQTWLHNLVKYLPADVDSHVVCRSARNRQHFPGMQIHAFKEESFGRYLAYRIRYLLGNKRHAPYLQSKIAELNADLVHSHFGNNGWKAMDAVIGAGRPHFVSFYGQDVSKLPRDNPAWLGRYRELFNAPRTRFICEGNHMAKCLVAMGCDASRIHVHHLGVEIDQIPFQPRQWLPGEPLKVLMAASFREKKGLPYAIEALGRIRQRQPLELTIIGDAGKDKAGQNEKQRILDAIDRGGLGPYTRRLGYQPQKLLWDEASRHHLFLSTSVSASDGDTEGGAPVALIDMAASGMAIVSSFHCDIPEVIRHGETGWLAEERNVDDIVKAIERWLNNPGGWAAMLAAGRQHVESQYHAVTQGQHLAAIYRAGLDAPRDIQTP
jgi:colanic acid/amylovoran biosynthesis glycosyltransferase